MRRFEEDSESTAAQGVLNVKAAKDEDSVYSTYYNFSQAVSKLAGHRVLAIDRGEKEGFLKASVKLDEARAHHIVVDSYVKGACFPLQNDTVAEAAKDAYSRLIFLQ